MNHGARSEMEEFQQVAQAIDLAPKVDGDPTLNVRTSSARWALMKKGRFESGAPRVTLKECASNPSAVLQRAKDEGAIVVTDAQNRPRGILCSSASWRALALGD
jgi:hypothetical protein